MTREQQEKRERRAMELMALGLSTNEIARRLRLTPRRIQQFRRNWQGGRIPVAA